jgi:hypothetical protein
MSLQMPTPLHKVMLDEDAKFYNVVIDRMKGYSWVVCRIWVTCDKPLASLERSVGAWN